MSRPISHRSHHRSPDRPAFARHTRTLPGSTRFRIDSLPSFLLLAPFSVRSLLDLSLVLSLISPSLPLSLSLLSSLSLSLFLFLSFAPSLSFSVLFFSYLLSVRSSFPPESHVSSSPRWYIIIADRSHDHCRGHQRSRRQQQSSRVPVTRYSVSRRGVRSREISADTEEPFGRGGSMGHVLIREERYPRATSTNGEHVRSARVR